MIKPKERLAKIDARRFDQWCASFAGYRRPVNAQFVGMWLDQFSPKNRDLAARVLDSVLFLSHDHVRTCFRSLLQSLDGWHITASKRRGRWFFVPFTGSPGESGDTMLHTLRMATGLNKKQFNELFIYRSDLVLKKPGPDDTVVLVDDFSGTGEQACDAWKDVFAELLTGSPRIVLLLVAATKIAVTKVRTETDMELICGTTLTEKDNVFHSECKHFTRQEKDTLYSYCRRANPNNPRGYGESGLVLVFAHQCPNNSIPILHENHEYWQGLFPATHKDVAALGLNSTSGKPHQRQGDSFLALVGVEF